MADAHQGFFTTKRTKVTKVISEGMARRAPTVYVFCVLCGYISPSSFLPRDAGADEGGGGLRDLRGDVSTLVAALPR
jgi:hypothetical protein